MQMRVLRSSWAKERRVSMEAMMQPSRVPILNSAAVMSATSGHVEPYYILKPDGEHGPATSKIVV